MIRHRTLSHFRATACIALPTVTTCALVYALVEDETSDAWKGGENVA